MEESPLLGLLAEKTLQQSALPEHVAYCPTMDLIALATHEDRVYVYRLNGQRVVGLSNKTIGVKVKKLRWKPNGQLLAVAWGDRTIRLINTDTSKIVHQIEVGPGGSTKTVTWGRLAQHQDVTCLGWGVNFTDSAQAKARIDTCGSTLEELLGHASLDSPGESFSDLPRELALLDVETTVPKLSTLPSAGKDEDLFSSRASLDSMFHPKKENGAVDVLVAGFTNGFIHLSIFDSFVIGVLDIRKSAPEVAGSEIVLHASHPYSSTHSLLASTPTAQGQQLYFVPLDLRFIISSGSYLSLLASKSTQLQNLLRYIGQVQRAMLLEWRTAQDLPGKFIRNVDESLRERSHCDFINAAYHLVVTGDCYAPMKEWLVEELAERGHKRWDKAVTTGYENVRQMAHETLLPALERCCLVVSRLRGLSRYQDSSAKLGLSTQDLNSVLDVVSCLILSAHSILKHAGTELRQFSAFSTWLRHEIDVQASDVSSADDPAEKDNTIDHARVLEYIQGAMTKSKLADFFPQELEEGQRPLIGTRSGGTSIYEDFKNRMAKHEVTLQLDKRLPCLRLLTRLLEDQCSVVFEQIAEAQKRNVLFGSPIKLGPELGGTPMDMRMMYDNGISTTFIVVRSDSDPSQLHVHRLSLKVENGVSSSSEIALATSHVRSGIIMDAKFIDDHSMMILWAIEGQARLLRIEYHATTESPATLQYSILDKARQKQLEASPSVELSNDGASSPYTCHTYDSSAFQPVKLEVNGRKGRRVICILGEDGQQYQVLDLDSSSADVNGDASEQSSVADLEMSQ